MRYWIGSQKWDFCGACGIRFIYELRRHYDIGSSHLPTDKRNLLRLRRTNLINQFRRFPNISVTDVSEPPLKGWPKGATDVKPSAEIRYALNETDVRESLELVYEVGATKPE